MRCSVEALRWTLFLSNLAIWALGIAAITVGALILEDEGLREIRHNLIDFRNYKASAILIIVVGVFILLIGFLGCFSTYFMSRFVFLIYGAAVSLVVILEIAAMALAWRYGTGAQLEDQLSIAVKRMIFKSKEGLQDVTRFLDYVQYELKCCGGDGIAEDYYKEELIPPVSCYKEGTTDINDKGCGKAIKEFLMRQSLKAGLVALFVLLSQVIAVVATILLYLRKVKMIKESRNKQDDDIEEVVYFDYNT